MGLTLTLSSKNRKRKVNWKENENKKEKIKSLLFSILTFSPSQGFFSGETDFHLRQFFSNFLKYNLPSSQLCSNLPIYFPGSLLLLYSSAPGFPFILFSTSIFSYHLTSTFNLSLNSSTNSLAFTKSSSFSHISCSAVNPFHYTRYFSIPLTFLWFNILSTFHSSSSLTFIGLASFFFWPPTYSLYCTIWLMFITRWILIKIGNRNLTTLVDTTSSMLWQPLITKTNDHTSGKSLSGISSGEFTRELDKESLLN